MYEFTSTYAHHDHSRAAIIVLSTTTDFAARTQRARDAARYVAMVVCGANARTVDEALDADGPWGVVRTVLATLSAELGESVTLRRVAVEVANEQ